MKIGFIDSRKVTILAALLIATLAAGCYGPGWGGGGGWWGGGPSYYNTDVYRGYGGYSRPGWLGGYPSAHDTWAASTRGRTSYGGGGEHAGGGQHASGGGGGHGGGGSHGR